MTATDKDAEVSDPRDALAVLRAGLDTLRAEHEDLQLLYEAVIAHSEVVEDQLAESNLELRATQKRLEAELEDAARYVMSILPEPRAANPATDWQLVPSTELGGDSFGYHEIDGDHLAIYLIDVCGHGVGAALLSVTVVNVLRNSALAADFRDPPAVLAALNAAFPMERHNDMYFTVWYGVHDRRSGRLCYATGGHPPAIHLRTDTQGAVRVTLLATAGGMAIGAIEGAAYRAAELAIVPGDRLLVLSDGTFEVDGPGGAMLGIADLADRAAKAGDDPRDLLEWVRSFGGDAALPDDFSLLRLRF